MTNNNSRRTETKTANNAYNSAVKKVNTSTQKTANGVKNLKVNNNKLYNLVKSRTKLVLNTAGHGLIVISLAHFVLYLGAPLWLVLTGGVVLVKTVLHAKKTNDIILRKKTLKKSKK